MDISDVRVRLINDGNDRLKAVCTVTFDEQFVVRDVKIVEGTSGLFVAMPSRKVSVHCVECGFKNAIRSRFCNECGAKLPPSDAPEEDNGRSRLHRDIAHPITTPFRERLQAEVLRAYEEERRAPGQRSRRDDSEESPEQDNRGNVMEENDDEPAEELSEYDAIIAGFRSGGGGRPQRRESSGPRHRDGGGSQGRDRGPGRSDTRGNERGNRRDDRPNQRREGNRPPRSEDRPPRQGSRPTSGSNRPPREARSEVQSSQPRPIESVPAPTDGFGAGLMDDGHKKPAAKVAPPPRPAPPKPAPPPVIEQDDDETGSFGEGLL